MSCHVAQTSRRTRIIAIRIFQRNELDLRSRTSEAGGLLLFTSFSQPRLWLSTVAICMTARSSTRSSRKRTVRPSADCVVDRRSRFVSCPLCGANISWHNIKEHLDTVHETCQTSSDPENAHPASEQPSLAEQRAPAPITLLRYSCEHQPKTHKKDTYRTV